MTTRIQRRLLAKENNKQPVALTEIPRTQWSSINPDERRIEVWRSRDYLVQVFDEGGGMLRVSVNRTHAAPGGRWDDGITWDELQQIKREIGRGDSYAVEVYPRDRDVVNVANMRHLWILPKPLAIGWVVEQGG